jgi:hypothetical protein
LTGSGDELQAKLSLKGICAVNPHPLISKTSQGGKHVTLKTTPNAGRVSGHNIDRLDEIEIVVPLSGKAQDSILEVLEVARRLGYLLTFLIGKHTTVQPYRCVAIDQSGKEREVLPLELMVKVGPSSNLLDVDLSARKMDQLLFSPDGEMRPITRQLNHYFEACQPQLIDQILGFYKVLEVEEPGEATKKERTLRNLFSHSKLDEHQTAPAAREYFGSEDVLNADRSKIEAARDELETHARRIISKKLAICWEPLKFYK